MKVRLSAIEAARNLSDLLRRVRYRGEHLTLGELRRALASLPPPDDDFRSDLQRIRSEQPRAGPSWSSPPPP